MTNKSLASEVCQALNPVIHLLPRTVLNLRFYNKRINFSEVSFCGVDQVWVTDMGEQPDIPESMWAFPVGDPSEGDFNSFRGYGVCEACASAYHKLKG